MRWLEREWEKFGRKDPYFGVLSQEKFRATRIDAAARAEFFETGERHVATCFETIRRCLAPSFAPRRTLDFGCGVGRLVIPFARRCAERWLAFAQLCPSWAGSSPLPGPRTCSRTCR